MSNNYSALTFGELCDRLTERANTVIIFHDRPDGDATGSAFALRALLMEMGSETYCVCADEVHHRCRFAVEGLYESVLPENLPRDFKIERVISVDTAARPQIKGLEGRFDVDVDFMIDHHGRGEPYADYYVDANAAACGEIVYDIGEELIRRGVIAKFPQRFCLLTYMAIATDTGCFKYSNTTPATHRRVAGLMDGSFDYADVNFRLFDCKSAEELKVGAAAQSNMRYFFDGKLAIAALDYKQVMALGVPADYFDGLIATARSIEGVEVAISVRQMTPEHVFRVSTRSNGEADVSALCAIFGGGGHVKAAGCSVSADSLDDAVALIVEQARILFGF